MASDVDSDGESGTFSHVNAAEGFFAAAIFDASIITPDTNADARKHVNLLLS